MPWPIRVFLALTLTSAGLAAQVPAPSVRTEDQGALVLDRAEERDLSGTVVHRWIISAQAGQYVKLAVENKEVDVIVRVLTPSGAERRMFQHAGYSGTQIVRWIADVPGDWAVDVASIGQGASGKYRVVMTAQGTAGQRERSLIEADTLLERADKLNADGQLEDAERLLDQAVKIAEQGSGPESMDVAGVLHELADVHQKVGRYAKTAEYIERALRIEERETGPDSLNVGVSLNNLGTMYQRQGRYRDAEPRLERAYQIRVKHLGPEHQRIGITLDNLATVYIALGRYADAEQCARQALGIFERALGPEHYYVSFPLRILASIAQRQRQYADAEPLLKRALAIDQATLSAEHPNFAMSLNRLAINQAYLGQRAEAQTLYERALAITTKALGADHPSVAEILWNLAHLHVENRDYEKGRMLYAQVLSIERAKLGVRHPRVAGTLVELARIDFEAIPPRIAEAKAQVDEAISILDEAAGHLELKVSAYALRAQLYRQAKDPVLAIRDLAEAIRIIEELRPLLGGAEETRARVFEHYADHFDRMVTWQMEAGDLGRAFEYAERGLARVLLDQLAAGRVDLRGSIEPQLRAQLEARENAALGRVSELEFRITRTRSHRELTDDQRMKQIAEIQGLLKAAEQEYAQVYAQIKSASPLWRDQITVGGGFVSLATVQRELVPANGLILTYHIGNETSYLFVAVPAGQPVIALPLRVDAEHARLLNVAEGRLTTTMLRSIINGSQAGAPNGIVDVMSSNAQRGLRGDITQLRTSRLHALWQVLVPQQIRQRVLTAAEVVIVPDGPLHQLPFEALVTSTGPEPAASRYWVDEGPSTRYAPSATFLYNVSKRPQARLFAQSSTPTVLTLSDPVYDAAEVLSAVGMRGRPVPPDARAAAGSGAVTRNSYERLGGSLARLPGTALETDAIRRAFGNEAAATVEVLQGLQATEPAFRRALSGKHYLHLATHALVGGGREALFASLVLTPPTAEQRDSNADGFLQLHEIYDLKLPDVELAVLSACDTNRGPSLEGEGVFALSRGFITAGARRVIASQWAVDDASTAALMGAMFEPIVAAQRAGRPVDFARALREAKRHVRNRPEWADPYYWAPFVLAGVQ